jgi:glutamine synthetase
MIRIPEAGRFELRLADDAANPCLLPAGILGRGGGLDGIRTSAIRADASTSTCTPKATEPGHVKRLPLDLLDALRAYEANIVLRDAFGDDLVVAYLKLRHGECNSYARRLTEWKRRRTLDSERGRRRLRPDLVPQPKGQRRLRASVTLRPAPPGGVNEKSSWPVDAR